MLVRVLGYLMFNDLSIISKRIRIERFPGVDSYHVPASEAMPNYNLRRARLSIECAIQPLRLFPLESDHKSRRLHGSRLGSGQMLH